MVIDNLEISKWVDPVAPVNCSSRRMESAITSPVRSLNMKRVEASQ